MTKEELDHRNAFIRAKYELAKSVGENMEWWGLRNHERLEAEYQAEFGEK